MKNLKLILLAFAATAFVACNDAIDIEQPSETDGTEIFRTVRDMELGLNGIYSVIGGETEIIFTSIFTDEVAVGVANGGQGLSGDLAFVLDATTPEPAAIWVSYYRLINTASRLIAADDMVPVEAGSEEEEVKERVLAEARVLRAYAHFKLLSYFSEDMTDDNSLGVVVLDYVPAIDAELPRNTTGEVFAFIEDELDAVYDDLLGTRNDKYVTKHMVNALRARMAAYRENYAEAFALVNTLDVTYNVQSRATYAAIWTDTEVPASSEVIWRIGRTSAGGGNFVGAWSSVNATVTGSPFYEVNRALFNLVDFGNGTTTGDIRRLVLVHPTAAQEELIMAQIDIPAANDTQYRNNDILPVGKYARTENTNLLADLKAFRFSEMVLIRAEYYASIGDKANAIAQVNLIRSNRYPAGTGTIATPGPIEDVWYAIMNERRAELAFEGHRYIDIRRLGPKAGRGVERFYRDCAFNGFCTLPGTDYRFIMPIPIDEIAANPNIQQNPNY